MNIYRWICNVLLHCTRVWSQDYYVISIPASSAICSGCPLLLTLASPFALLKSAFQFSSDCLPSQVIFLSPHVPSLLSLTYRVDHVLTVAPHFLPILPYSSQSLLSSACLSIVHHRSVLVLHALCYSIHFLGFVYSFLGPCLLSGSPNEAHCSVLCSSHTSITQRVKQVWLIHASLPPFPELGIPPFFCRANSQSFLFVTFFYETVFPDPVG